MTYAQDTAEELRDYIDQAIGKPTNSLGLLEAMEILDLLASEMEDMKRVFHEMLEGLNESEETENE